MAGAIPRSVTLPGGFRVRVRYLQHGKLQDLARRIANARDDEDVWALWDEAPRGNGGVIYLTHGRHPLLLVTDFRHEFGHAWNEWLDWWDEAHGINAVIERAAARDEESEE
jgi:hypothetical protein